DLAQATQVAHALERALAVAVEQDRGGAQAQPVGGPDGLLPLVDRQVGGEVPGSVRLVEHLHPGARHRVGPGGGEGGVLLGHGAAGAAGAVDDVGGTERVQVQIGCGGTRCAQHLFVDVGGGVVGGRALQAQLGGSEVDGVGGDARDE